MPSFSGIGHQCPFSGTIFLCGARLAQAFVSLTTATSAAAAATAAAIRDLRPAKWFPTAPVVGYLSTRYMPNKLLCKLCGKFKQQHGGESQPSQYNLTSSCVAVDTICWKRALPKFSPPHTLETAVKGIDGHGYNMGV